MVEYFTSQNGLNKFHLLFFGVFVCLSCFLKDRIKRISWIRLMFPWTFKFVKIKQKKILISDVFRSREPKAQEELIVYQSSRRLSVCQAVCLWTFSNSNISATSGPIVTSCP